MICRKLFWENWEWGDDDLNPETKLELENFGLSMFHFLNSFLKPKLKLNIFVVFLIMGIGIISGLLVLFGEIVVHRFMK